MVNTDVIWRSYEDRRDITTLHDICWYSGWIMADQDRVCLHLSEQVLRQYGYYQSIPISPTIIGALDISKGVDRQGRRNRGSMRRGTSDGSTVYLILCCESGPIAEYTTRVPPYEEVIVEQHDRAKPQAHGLSK